MLQRNEPQPVPTRLFVAAYLSALVPAVLTGAVVWQLVFVPYDITSEVQGVLLLITLAGWTATHHVLAVYLVALYTHIMRERQPMRLSAAAGETAARGPRFLVLLAAINACVAFYAVKQPGIHLAEVAAFVSWAWLAEIIVFRVRAGRSRPMA